MINDIKYTNKKNLGYKIANCDKTTRAIKIVIINSLAQGQNFDAPRENRTD